MVESDVGKETRATKDQREQKKINQPTIENKGGGGDHKEKLSMNCETINADIHGCVFLVSMDNALDYRSRP